jgi:hypothetical protein
MVLPSISYYLIVYLCADQTPRPSHGAQSVALQRFKSANSLDFSSCNSFSRCMRLIIVSAKVKRLTSPLERCPSGLRSTLGKRV